MFIYIHIISYYKLLFYSNLFLSVMLDSLSYSFTSVSFLTNVYGQSETFLICNKSNTTGVTFEAGTAYPSGAPAFTPDFSEIHFAQSFYVVFCRSLFVISSFFFWPLYCMTFLGYSFWLPRWYLQTLRWWIDDCTND
jgi:hypothetical protein